MRKKHEIRGENCKSKQPVFPIVLLFGSRDFFWGGSYHRHRVMLSRFHALSYRVLWENGSHCGSVSSWVGNKSVIQSNGPLKNFERARRENKVRSGALKRNTNDVCFFFFIIHSLRRGSIFNLGPLLLFFFFLQKKGGLAFICLKTWILCEVIQ